MTWMDISLKSYYAERKKLDSKRVHTIQFYLYEALEKTQLIYSDRKQISDFLGLIGIPDPPKK